MIALTNALVLALGPTPEGYGVGLEWLVYLTFLIPTVLLIVLWWLGNRRIV